MLGTVIALAVTFIAYIAIARFVLPRFGVGT